MRLALVTLAPPASPVHFRTLNPNIGHPAASAKLERAAPNADIASGFGLRNAALTSG